MAGLSAAHELAERGFDVTVYEQRDAPGGKARSIPVAGLRHGRARRPARRARLPLLPGLLPPPARHDGADPGRRPARSRDHLVGATRILFAQAGGPNEIIAPAHLPESAERLRRAGALPARGRRRRSGVPPHEYAILVERLLTLLTSCDERRIGQWDLQSWWDFTGAERRSAAFQRFLADGLTRTLVAARGREMSARTGGAVLIQLLQDLTRAGGRADRVLDAPTSEVWIDPWVAHVRVARRRTCASARRSRRCTSRAGGSPAPRSPGSAIAGRPLRRRAARRGHAPARLAGAAGRRAAPEGPRPARHALDERGALLPRPRRAARQRPRHLHRLRVVADLDLAEAVLARRRPRRGAGDGRVRGILSIDVSEWQRPGRRTGKVAQLLQPARRSSRRCGASSRTTSTARSTA